MGRQSSIKKLPQEVKTHLDKLLRWDKFTLDEILDSIRAEYPQHAEELPSRTAIWRYQQTTKKMIEDQRNIQAMSETLVAELGESFDDKTTALLSSMMTNLASNAVMGALNEDKIAAKELLELARATNQAIEASQKSLKVRQAIEKSAQEKLIAQQKAKLNELGKTGEVPQEMLAKVIKAAYGLES